MAMTWEVEALGTVVELARYHRHCWPDERSELLHSLAVDRGRFHAFYLPQSQSSILAVWSH